LINQSTTSALGDSNIQQTGEDLNSLQPDFGWGMGMGMNGWGMGMGMNMGLDDQVDDDGFGWLSGLGAGEGFFGTDNANANGDEGDHGFAQDPFWSVFSSRGLLWLMIRRSILEHAPRPQ
jgi:hypothetical protein